MHGRLMLVMRSERTVRASPIQRKPTGSARKYTIVPAHRPKKQRVARTPAHRARDACAALEPHLLRDQARGSKADARDGEGCKQHAHRHDELVQPDAGRADAPDDPRLKDEPDAAHHDRRAGHERGVDDEPAICVHARDLPTQFVPLYGAGGKNMPPANLCTRTKSWSSGGARGARPVSDKIQRLSQSPSRTLGQNPVRRAACVLCSFRCAGRS